jgi:hypothetical protein
MTSNSTYEPLERTPSSYNPLHSFRLPKGENKHYQQQYGDMYFLRLAKLKPAVEAVAKEAWDEIIVWRCWLMKDAKTQADCCCVTDSRRDGPESREGAGCTTGTAMLGRWYGVYGYAVETEYLGGYFERCTPRVLVNIVTTLTWFSNGYPHLRPTRNTSPLMALQLRQCWKTNLGGCD